MKKSNHIEGWNRKTIFSKIDINKGVQFAQFVNGKMMRKWMVAPWVFVPPDYKKVSSLATHWRYI